MAKRAVRKTSAATADVKITVATQTDWQTASRRSTREPRTEHGRFAVDIVAAAIKYAPGPVRAYAGNFRRDKLIAAVHRAAARENVRVETRAYGEDLLVRLKSD